MTFSRQVSVALDTQLTTGEATLVADNYCRSIKGDQAFCQEFKGRM